MLESTPFADPRLGLLDNPLSQTSDVLVVGLPKDGSMGPTMAAIDKATDGWLGRLIAADQIRGRRGELTLIASPLGSRTDPVENGSGERDSADGGPTMILVAGLGDLAGESSSRSLAFDTASSVVRRLADRKRERVVFALAESFPEDWHDCLVAGSLFGCEGQAIYQSEPASHVPGMIDFVGISDQSLQRGQIIGTSINHTRRLVNEPAAMIYPESFAKVAEEIGADSGVEVEVWDEAKLEAEGCRAILAVGQASDKPPRLLIMRYRGGGDEAPLALVGKGVTFDSGGLSLKPSDGMADMKCDMAGAATVVGVMRGIAKLGVKQNVIGLCGLAENMVSANSYKLGDVIETRSGKTIEILNTDAEGRVVLADTLDVAIQHQPRAMVDLATLTGACMVALGTEVAGLMPNNSSLCNSIKLAATDQGEPVWQLPMFDLYDDKIKSKVADIKNVGEGRWGGAITAAKFLENFVGDVPWVHIDIAGPAFADAPKPHRDAGATGVMVRTLIQWVETASTS